MRENIHAYRLSDTLLSKQSMFRVLRGEHLLVPVMKCTVHNLVGNEKPLNQHHLLAKKPILDSAWYPRLIPSLPYSEEDGD